MGNLEQSQRFFRFRPTNESFEVLPIEPENWTTLCTKVFHFSPGKGDSYDSSPSKSTAASRSKTERVPTQDNSFSKELLRHSWERFNEAWKPGDKLIPAVIAEIVIHDSNFAQLLNEADRAQMLALSKLALERFEENTNPPNKFGKTLAAILEVSK